MMVNMIVMTQMLQQATDDNSNIEHEISPEISPEISQSNGAGAQPSPDCPSYCG